MFTGMSADQIAVRQATLRAAAEYQQLLTEVGPPLSDRGPTGRIRHLTAITLLGAARGIDSMATGIGAVAGSAAAAGRRLDSVRLVDEPDCLPGTC